MTRSLTNSTRLLAPLAVFGAVWALLTLVNRAPDTPAGGAPAATAVALGDGSARGYTAFGDAQLTRARETGDPGAYERAGRAFDAALRRDPRDVGALIGAGTLANLRHDFDAGLRLGHAALRAQPDLARPSTVIADAQIELGRYDAAAASIQRLLDLKPGLPAYARASYYRELSGDQAGAVAAMRLAASAAGTPGDAASVRVLLGDLELTRGRMGAADRAYRAALAAVPGDPRALAGLARVVLARGADGRAIALLRRSTERLPLTTNLTLLAEVERVAGRRAAAARDLAVVRAQHRLLGTAGAAPDAERVLFAADHGSPARAVALGRRVWQAAPSVRSADALGWALTRAGRPEAGLRWAQRALRLGSRDPLWRLHAGIAAQRAGREEAAARHLRVAATGRAALSPRAIDQLRIAAGRVSYTPGAATDPIRTEVTR